MSNDFKTIGKIEKELKMHLKSVKLSDVDKIIKSYTIEQGEVVGLNLAELPPYNLKNYSVLSRLTHLRYLDLSGNNLCNIEFLSPLVNLTDLNLSWNKDIEDYSYLSSLTQLTNLNLSGNNLKDISFLSSHPNLKSLNLAGNNISDVSPLTLHTQLMTLNLAGNNLGDISFLSSFENLTFLNLAGNNISNISFISSLTKLTSVNLSSNNLSDVAIIKDLPSIKHINLENNPLNNPPSFIAEKGIEPILRYYKLLDEHGDAKLYEARILIVGEQDAGKTTLLKKILNPNYPVPNKKEETIGIEINNQWEFTYNNDKHITFKCNFWDFGGQPIQYMLHQYFLASRCLYILVLDDQPQRTRFDYWFNIIKILGEKSPVLVVLNEIQNHTISDFDYNKYKKRFAQFYSIEKRDVDFKNNDGRLEALKKKIEEMLSNLPHIGDKLPSQWVSIRKDIEDINYKNQISINDYFGICRKHNLTDEQDMLTLCDYLHVLGAVIHYKDDNILADTIFINPHWIVDALYTVITDKSLEKSKGRFKKEWLFELWEGKGYSYDEQCKLLKLLLKNKFEICYRFSGKTGKDEEYILPMLLSDVEPSFNPVPEIDTLKFRFKYSFMPEGIIARLMVRLSENIEKHEGQDLIWKRGFILRKDGNLAEVREDILEKVIDIKVSGENCTRRDFLSIIRFEIQKIHERPFKEIQVEEMVPCNCAECNATKTPLYFEYSTLLTFLKKGETKIHCLKSTKEIKIGKLVDPVVPPEENRERYISFKEKNIENQEFVSPLEQFKQLSKDIEKRINKKEEELDIELKKKAECENIAKKKANRIFWWIVLFHILFVSILVFLIFKFKWQKMEPWITMVGSTGLSGIISGVYFARYKKKLNSEEIMNKFIKKNQESFHHLSEVSTVKINRLTSEIEALRSKKKRLWNA